MTGTGRASLHGGVSSNKIFPEEALFAERPLSAPLLSLLGWWPSAGPDPEQTLAVRIARP